MNEDFVSRNIAVKLRGKGFHLEKSNLQDGSILLYNLLHVEKISSQNEAYRLPSIYQVLKWLREKGKVHIIIDVSERGWFCNFRCLRTGYVMNGTHLGYSDSFLQASLEGIEYVLDNLI